VRSRPRRSRRRKSKRKHAPNAWTPNWVREIVGRIVYFLAAVAVGCGIMLLVTLPILVAVWYLLRYAARQ
jgi:hypothetical protein